MLIKKPHDIKPSEITAPEVYVQRRTFLKAAAAGAAFSTPAAALVRPAGEGEAIPDLLDTPYGEGLELTPYKHVTGYNNFYEFGLDKEDPKRHSKGFKTDDWSIRVSGACNKPGEYGLEDLVKPHSIEERIYLSLIHI